MKKEPAKSQYSVTPEDNSPQDRVYKYVKDQIMAMAFRPGSLITDTQLAAQLNMSRSPVREALHRLTNDGLLRYEFGRGWKVYALTLSDISEIFEMKTALEGMMAGKAANCEDPELRHQLRQALARVQQAAITNDSEDWWSAEAHLTDLILTMGSNQRAALTIHKLNNQWLRVRTSFLGVDGQIRRTQQEYTAIVEQILKSDADEAERLMRAHVARMERELSNLLAQMVLPFVEEGI